MTASEPGRLGDELAELANHVEFPRTPPIASAVAGRLRGSARPRPMYNPWRSVRRGAALAVAAVLLVAGAVVAVGWGLGGLELRFGTDSRTPVSTNDLNVTLGERSTLAEARTRVAFDVVVPTLPALDRPDQVYVSPVPEGGRVTLLYGERPGFRANEQFGFSVLITEFRRDIGPETFAKLINAGVRVTGVTVDGRPGYWVAGGTHELIYFDENGEEVFELTRLVGDTLIWERGDVTLRIENAPDLASAIAIAESME